MMLSRAEVQELVDRCANALYERQQTRLPHQRRSLEACRRDVNTILVMAAGKATPNTLVNREKLLEARNEMGAKIIWAPVPVFFIAWLAGAASNGWVIALSFVAAFWAFHSAVRKDGWPAHPTQPEAEPTHSDAAAPPPPPPSAWRAALGFGVLETPTRELIHARYRQLAKQHHPDRGGSAQVMAEINAAFSQGMKELGYD